MDTILNVTNKETLTDEEVLQCQQVIFNVVAMESRHEPLALPIGHRFVNQIFFYQISKFPFYRLKGNKKEEQYRLLWAELETLLAASSLSPGHKVILQCIRDCRSRTPEQGSDKMELDQAIRELDGICKSALKNMQNLLLRTCLLLASEVSKRLSVIKATTDSPMSPPHSIPTEMLNSSKLKNSFGVTANR